jgi:hypothetical protein
MATVKQHNKIIGVVFNGNKHLNKVLTNDTIRNMTTIENRYPLTKLPVCGHCENLALWDTGGTARCPKCGWITKVPITYSTYLSQGYDIDRGTTAREVLKARDNATMILPNYGKIFHGRED